MKAGFSTTSSTVGYRLALPIEVNEGGAMVERRAQLVGLRGREILALEFQSHLNWCVEALETYFAPRTCNRAQNTPALIPIVKLRPREGAN